MKNKNSNRVSKNHDLKKTCKIINDVSNSNDKFVIQNITTKEYSKLTDELIEPYIFEWVSAKRGSISAEHGIGFKKTKYLHFSKSDELIHQMRLMKTAMDPNGILNPYKVLPF